MLIPERPLPTFTDGVCAVSDCGLPPGHPADLAALALGYAWDTRDPLPGLEPAFVVCAACVHAQAHEMRADAEAAGYTRAELACCA